MAYDHKKSLRTLTDEQFSDGTTIDGTRIDDALDESVEHFNNIPEGDVSTRFTKTQYVFGQQPAGYTGTPLLSGAVTHFTTPQGTVEGPTWPWNFIANNRHTSAAVNPGGAPEYGNPTTPTAGFQNEWRYKGTNVSQISGTGMQTVANEGAWADPNWVAAWGAAAYGAGPPYAQRNVGHAYQFAWSHSWVFDKPAILDCASFFLRTDRPYPSTGAASRGYYDAPFWFNDATLPTNIIHQTQGITIQISVDNEFSKEERDLNDVEFMFHNRRMDGYTVCQIPTPATTYKDMLPNSPEYGKTPGPGAGKGNMLNGRIIRFEDLYIPIRQGARVRMAIIIPWFRNTSSVRVLTDEQGLATGAIDDKFSAWAASPTGSEPMWGWAMDGCVTFLEEVTP